jgi:hypothetical protein
MHQNYTWGGKAYTNKKGLYDMVGGGIQLISSGTNELSVSESECQAYATEQGNAYSTLNNAQNPGGCFIHTGNNPGKIKEERNLFCFASLKLHFQDPLKK